MKRLNEVLPIEAQMVQPKKLTEVAGNKLVLHSAKPLSSGDSPFYQMVLSTEEGSTRFTVTANQQQIVDTLKLIINANAFRVEIMLVNMGKSYGIVDPVDYKA